MCVCDVVWSRLASVPVSICFLVGLVTEVCDISVSLRTPGQIIALLIITQWNNKKV